MSIAAMKLALEALETEQALRQGYSYRGGVRVVSTADEAINALRTAIQQPATGESLTETFVQKVPDHCDLVVWRGQYIHLPMTRAAIQQAEVTDEQILDIAAEWSNREFANGAWRFCTDFARAILALRELRLPLKNA